MSHRDYDFCGWATRANIRCSDGRTIQSHAFNGNDGQIVPLVWNHNHSSADCVLGHCMLKDTDEGVYAYGYFNNTDEGLHAKELVKSGDVNALSIYANQLKENGDPQNRIVSHGVIREVSLVLAGANPGAYIEDVAAHGDDEGLAAQIWGGPQDLHANDKDELEHSEDSKMDEDEKKDETEEKSADESGKTVGDVLNTLTQEQWTAVSMVVGKVLEDHGIDSNSDEKESSEMKHNVFEGDANHMVSNDVKNDLKPIDIQKDIIHSGVIDRVGGSLKAAYNDLVASGDYQDINGSYLAHGISEDNGSSVGNLFPETKPASNVPSVLSRDKAWVADVMNSVHHIPFSRVRSTYFDITADQARAKGYIKGKQKVEEVISAFKRTTDPQTVYKLQRMNRDDVIDITDFDVVMWIKAEMRTMLDEELARAFLIGDGRLVTDEDKISEDHIRPIWTDKAPYVTKEVMKLADGKSEIDDDFTKEFIKSVIRQRKNYKGSGNPVFYTTEDMLTNMLLLTDTTGRDLYDSVDKLATKLRVSKIVTIPVMDSAVRKNDEQTKQYQCLGIVVNLRDYAVGADKGGAVTMFDDFDIDFNKYKYLIETRCSGALTEPKSALVFELETAVDKA